MGKLLTVQELSEKREQAALVGAAESTLEAAKVADRERSGLLMRGNGSLVRKSKREGVYVSALKSALHSTSVTQRSQVQVRPGVEVLVWDAMVRADRVLVAAGCRSVLVKRATNAVLTTEQRMRAEAMKAKRGMHTVLAVAVSKPE